MERLSNSKLDKMGDILRNYPQNTEALKAVLFWRDLHIAPLLSFQRNLYRKSSKVNYGKKSFIAKRLKRMPTIINKLQRQSKMQLSRMQDVGGIRIILDDIKKVRELEKIYNKSTTCS